MRRRRCGAGLQPAADFQSAWSGAAAVLLSACSDIDRVPKGQADVQSLKTALDAYKLDRDLSGHEYIYTYPGQVSVRREAR